MNVAFWDPDARRLVEHDRVALPSAQVVMAACELSMLWQCGPHAIPSPYWAVWREDDPTAEELRVFFLNGQPDLSDAEIDRMRAAAARLAHAH